ncbi:MAG: AbrB/MazE/SpoVT family DNA-binding domain-containing protein [Candidatus Promineofilum sp.]|nr:AbrB/MazE/SpoVT family DNA-binding domain-containing protein [Promineifilum sp.]MCW5861858.1 AbrB/MazE/SpoVT family DNA-binding domain-containing protein [Anaerolineae bacterium]
MLYGELKTYSIQVRQRGQLTLPRRLRESLAIEDGDTLTIFQVGETLLLAPRALKTPELMDRLATMLDESDVTLADLLADLPRIREEIYRERYQTDPEE